VREFGFNLALAVLWAAVMGSIDPANLIVGFVFAYLVLWLSRPALGETSYFRKAPQAIGFALFFIKELIISNVRVAHDIVTPKSHMRPAIVAVPLDVTSDEEITMLANVVTLTPGTLSLDVSPDRRTLYVHGMFVDDPEDFRREIKDGFELRVRELLR
jgi:multicomponent Na+:H+ antiporter subunit E